MSEVKKNILVYRLGSLGDTVMALPCFHKIKQSYPNAHMTLLTNKPVVAKAAPLEAVLGSGNFFDEIVTYPVGTRNPAVLLALNRKIRSLNIDTVVNITALRSAKADYRDQLFFQLAGVQKLIGFEHPPEEYKVRIDPTTGQNEWEAKRLARKVLPLGLIDLNDDAYWDLKLSDSEYESANLALKDLRFDENIIAINAGTKMPVKDWGAENWLSLVNGLYKKLPHHKLVIVGVDEEKELANQLLERWEGNGLNLCGKTSPRVSAAILKKAKIFIGHDSGPMHLAACVGTPCVGIFSCINKPRQWFPRGEQNRIILPKTACAANDVKRCVEVDQNCISSIEVNAVIQEVLALLNQISVA